MLRFLWPVLKFIIRRSARSRGFVDPFNLMAQLSQFSKPSEVMAPTELLRHGAIMHARGLLNHQAIQHNLDWVWPYWVNRQFDPHDRSFLPRSFSLTHINLTHRNWTAVGLPDEAELPIVDPRGLVMPFFDSWSIDGWIVSEGGKELLPSRLLEVDQSLQWGESLCVVTRAEAEGLALTSRVQVIPQGSSLRCRIDYHATAFEPAWLIVAIRPYNPEGISLVKRIELNAARDRWTVDRDREVYLKPAPDRHLLSEYHRGDVYHHLPNPFAGSATGQAEFTRRAKSRGGLFQFGQPAAVLKGGPHEGNRPNGQEYQIRCEVGMATGAALYRIEPAAPAEVQVDIPLREEEERRKLGETVPPPQVTIDWEQALAQYCRMEIPDAHFQFLYEAALRTLLLHAPGEVYPGPFTYKRFWFRDAAFIIYALLGSGFDRQARRALDGFPERQQLNGYFCSQRGEWDSNGQALWIMGQYCDLTGRAPPPDWQNAVRKGAEWIQKKRLSKDLAEPQAGLLPAGFSAEHLGPNDYYFWDSFWSVAGLRKAADLLESYGEIQEAEAFRREAEDLFECIDKSLDQAERRLGTQAMPAAPLRRLDAGSIGSLAVSYPLKIWPPGHPRSLETANYLRENYFVNGGFFQQMTHSGLNPYLTLHIAQVLLREGDARFFEPVDTVARLASPTGQWPEAVHPNTGGGCMGDGQHVWAAAEWVLMMRALFVREEGDRLILCSGIPENWQKPGATLRFGPAPTRFGPLTVNCRFEDKRARLQWQADWRQVSSKIAVRIPGFRAMEMNASAGEAVVPRGEKT